MEDDSFEIVPAEPFPVTAATNPVTGERRPKKKFVHPKLSAEDKKGLKEKQRLRKARIILRNVSYKATEENIKEHFKKYGEVKECNLLKRVDGKLVGCAFIQFTKVNDAAKAIHHENAKEFLGRPVVIDWAVNRKKYEQHVRSARKEVKKEKADDEVSIKSEPEDDDEAEEDDENGEEASFDEEGDVKEEEEDGSSDEDSQEDEEDDDEVDDEDEKDEKKPIHKKSNDVAEGCTVFIKNLPFESTDADLFKVCRPFGPLWYAIVTKDKVSGHSKGTGFVKYKNKESADMCLNAGTTFTLLEQVLDPHPALSRTEVKQKSDSKKKEPADSRNLYLAKEGLIAAGSPAAEGVSASDMAKRLQLEQNKNQLLKDLNRFVSKERLTVHNIPPSFDSAKLRAKVIQACKLKPGECRIMRENKPSPGNPLGRSKGYGFLCFKTHEEAVQCLRKVNNNPTVFGKNNRPIVSFSIEDRAVYNLKMKRLKKSQENNPLNKKAFLGKGKEVEDKKPNKKKLRAEKRSKKLTNGSTAGIAEFAGVAAEKGGENRTRPLWKLREEAKEHNEVTKEKKKAQKKQKAEAAIRREKMQIERPKLGKRKNEADSALVNKYLQMLNASDAKTNAAPKTKRSKWYTE